MAEKSLIDAETFRYLVGSGVALVAMTFVGYVAWAIWRFPDDIANIARALAFALFPLG